MEKIISGYIAMVFLVSCHDLNPHPSPTISPNEEIYGPADSTFYYLSGTYKGVLPAKHSLGIEATMILNPDHTVYLHCEYPNKAHGIHNKNGIFTLNKDTLTIYLEGNNRIDYLVERQTLRMMNRYKKKINGLSKENFVFVKTEE